jgi:hypothetical protein
MHSSLEQTMNSHVQPNKTSVLTSWKEIANYMGKGVRTVQRWEQDFGLPVRRPCGSSKKAVLARPSDLDSWVALRCRPRGDAKEDSAVRPGELTLRSTLAAEIETSRALRAISRTVRGELRMELRSLHEHVTEMYRKCRSERPAVLQAENGRSARQPSN